MVLKQEEKTVQHAEIYFKMRREETKWIIIAQSKVKCLRGQPIASLNKLTSECSELILNPSNCDNISFLQGSTSVGGQLWA